MIRLLTTTKSGPHESKVLRRIIRDIDAGKVTTVVIGQWLEVRQPAAAPRGRPTDWKCRAANDRKLSTLGPSNSYGVDKLVNSVFLF